MASVKVGTGLGLHPHPGQVYPGDPVGGLGHVLHAGVCPGHVQGDGVLPEDSTGRPHPPLAPEVLQLGVGGPPPAANIANKISIRFIPLTSPTTHFNLNRDIGTRLL